MRHSRFFASAIAVVSLLASCTEADDTGDVMDEELDGGEGEPRDVRVPIPEEDPEHHMFLGGELVLEPGEDKTTCWHMEVPEDMALTDIETLQGEFGHHVIILSTNEPQPPGTVEDCTDATSLAKYKALLIPVSDTPPASAFWLEKGTPVVLQSHYVNASDEPILIRDLVRARIVPESSVETWLAPFTTTALDFEIPVSDEIAELTFDCELERDVDLLYVGGHMHEWGVSYEVQLGASAEELETIYDVSTWIPDFRDVPPIEIYTDNPLEIREGSVIRTTCRWLNPMGDTLIFPEEMCASFGILAGSKEAYDCRVQTK
jgi:hypothetical protein